jgi:hypothetical protein
MPDNSAQIAELKTWAKMLDFVLIPKKDLVQLSNAHMAFEEMELSTIASLDQYKAMTVQSLMWQIGDRIIADGLAKVSDMPHKHGKEFRVSVYVVRPQETSDAQ